MDGGRRVVSALAIADERIVAVGDEEVVPSAGSRARVVDLAGRTVIPGFVDTHAHMDREGMRRAYPSLRGCRRVSDVLDVVRREAATRQPGEWVVLGPLGEPPFHMEQAETLAEGRLPDRRDLDAAAPDHLVWIRAPWGYWSNRPPFVHVFNSRALGICGMGRGATSGNRHVEIELDAAGEPTGRIAETHFSSILEFVVSGVPRVTRAQLRAALLTGMRASAAEGTVAVYEGHGVSEDLRAAYEDLHARGEQTIRAYLTLALPPWRSMAEMERFAVEAARIAGGRGRGDDLLTVGGVFLAYGGDGAVRDASDAAWPYTGWAAFKEQCVAPDEFAALSRIFARHRLRVGTIVGGAAATSDTLDKVLSVWEGIDREAPMRDLRWVLVHTAVLDRERDVPRIRRLGAVVTTQPASYLHRSGLDAIERGVRPGDLMPYRDWVADDLRWSLSTDNKPYAMPFTIWVAMARREMREGRVLSPDQSLGLHDALAAATIEGAYASFAEDRRGSLEPGKLADLVIADRDPTTDVDAMRELTAAATMIGGRVVHDPSGLLGA